MSEPDQGASPPTCPGQSEANKRAKCSSRGGRRRHALRLLRQDDNNDASRIKRGVREQCCCACCHTLKHNVAVS